MVRTQIQMYEDQWKWAKLEAVKKGVSMSQLIRDSIDTYRGHTERINGEGDRKRKAITAVGSFTSIQNN